jgi:hypothetical protein
VDGFGMSSFSETQNEFTCFCNTADIQYYSAIPSTVNTFISKETNGDILS